MYRRLPKLRGIAGGEELQMRAPFTHTCIVHGRMEGGSDFSFVDR